MSKKIVCGRTGKVLFAVLLSGFVGSLENGLGKILYVSWMTKAFKRRLFRPAKAAKLNWSVCLCHKRVVSAEPLSSFTERSWPTLVRAANIHKDSLESFLRSQSITLEAPGVPRGVYHRTCYQE